MIEQVIYDFIQKNERISQILSSYCGNPAVFNKIAPSDQDEGWEGQKQFPRLIFELNMQEDSERKISGILSVDCYITTDGDIFIEDVDELLKKELDGFFFTDGTDTIAIEWQQSDPFTTPESGNRINGITLTFNVSAFPKQITFGMDPVECFYLWAADMFPESYLVGFTDAIGKSAWKPSCEIPAIYCKLQMIQPSTAIPSTYHVTWYSASLQIHVFAPDIHVRTIILKKIIETLQQQTRIIFPDGSPLMIQRMIANMGANPLKAGQLTIEGSYGILRTYPQREKISNVDIKEVSKNG